MPQKISRLEKPSPWDAAAASALGKRTRSEDLRLSVTCATLAPSAHNAQPWLFRVQEDQIELYADLTRALPTVDSNHRELLIGCGAALHNLVLALRYFGYDSSVEILSKNIAPAEGETRVPIARIRLGGPAQPSPEECDLFHMISKRCTSRMQFERRPIPTAFLAEVEKVARSHRAWVRLLEAKGVREAMADFVAQGNRVQISDKNFRDELSSWSSSTAQGRRDGMPGYATGSSFVLTYAGQFLFRTFRFADWQARRDRNLVLDAPGLFLLGTDEDSVEHWLHAGEALEAIALRACLEGMWLAFLNQPIEVTLLRSYLAKEFGMEGYPQLLIRMGYGPASGHTPRRPLEEVLI
jgi:hypothetical protein